MKMNQLLAIGGVAVALFLGVGSVSAQNGGGGGGGNFDPAQMQQRILDNAREQLGLTNDTDWNAIQPLVQKVMDARRDVGGGGMSRLFGRGNRGGNTNNANANNNGGRRGGFGGTQIGRAHV